MGCCLSSNAVEASKAKQKKQNPLKSHHSPLKPSILSSQKTPFPPPEEEEEEAVIKEVLVLSETPTLHKKQQEDETQTRLTLPPETRAKVSSPNMIQRQQQQEQEQETSDLSQLSEIYSVTETVSVTTATNTTTKGSLTDDEARSQDNSEVKHKPKVIKKRPSNGDAGTGIGNVLARRVDPSPEKRARARSQGRGSAEMKTVRRNAGSRSRSPGNGRGTIGKSPTTVTEKPGNKPVGAGQGEFKREENGNDVVREQQPETSTTESLENPLVSLECFIFL